MSEWISVEDRMPITKDDLVDAGITYRDEEVIATNGRGVWPERFVAGNTLTFWCRFTGLIEVTHWMPLPEPPND